MSTKDKPTNAIATLNNDHEKVKPRPESNIEVVS